MGNGERTLTIRLIGEAASAQKALKDTEAAGTKTAASANVLGDAFEKAKASVLGMVPGAANAESALGSMDKASEGAGINLKGALAGGAAAASVALVAMTAEGIEKFSKLSEEVLKFKDVTGASAEESSKFVAIAHGMGVETDSLSGAMFKMGNTIETTPSKLTDLGIAIAKNKDGTVDMAGTLANAAEAWRNSADATKQDAIAKAVGGKAGADLIPILKQGKDAVNEFASAAKNRGEIFGDKDLKQGEDYRKAMAAVHQATDGLEISLAKGLVPTLSEVAGKVTTGVDAVNKMTSAVGGMANIVGAAADAGNMGGHMLGQLIDVFDHHKDAVDASKESTGQLTAAEEAQQSATEAVTESAKEETAAYNAASKAIDDKVKAMGDELAASEASASADIAYAQSLISVGKVADTVTAAHETLNTAIRDHGAGSAEARTADLDLQSTILNGEQTYLDAAQKAVDLTAKHHEMAGEVYTVEQKHQDLIDKLNEFAGQVDGPIHDALEKYIGELNNIPAHITTQIAINGDDFQSVRRDALPGRATGGDVEPGSYIVGEDGPERLDLGSNGRGRVTSAAGTRAVGGGVTNHNTYAITMQIPLGVDGRRIGAQLVDYIKRYESANGAAWRNG
jgi:hypothetical protein